jgi:pantoate kinase
MIQDLVQQAASRTGLLPEQAKTALAAALSLIEKHAEPEKVKDLFANIQGAQALAEEGSAMTKNKSGGLIAGMMKNVGGAGGAAMSDAMALGQKLARQGVTTADMQSILPVAMEFVQKATGRDLLREVLVTIPGLGPLLTPED